MTASVSFPRICVVGLGYVGLPLAVRLARHFDVVGIDVNGRRIDELRSGHDATGEIDEPTLKEALSGGLAGRLALDADIETARGCGIYVIAVPTPTDHDRNPDLRIVRAASRSIGGVIERGGIVVLESTVAPGTTRNVVGAIVEEVSGLVCGEGFTLGYSPERINPGDKVNTVERVTKIVSGQDEKTLDVLCAMYGAVTAGNIHRARELEVAEAAKLFENTQRDVNIALMNQFDSYCQVVGISIWQVVDAMRTKWNALPFTPGLVGGHCIGEDPYYLIGDAERRGLELPVVAWARRVNNDVALRIAERITNELLVRGRTSADILVMGLTFKENVPDVRNSLVFTILEALRVAGHRVTVVDPVADLVQVEEEVRHLRLSGPVRVLREPPRDRFDCVFGAVAHEGFAGIDPASLLYGDGFVFDARRIWGDQTIVKV